jgi:dienelactone hydrolase
MLYNPFARGPHPVGVRTIAVSDESRESRRLEVELWYPASARSRGLDQDEATCDRFTIAPGLGGRQQAVREAQVADGRFPMVLYSHAAASHRRDAALLGPHLASHGYIVAAPDHPGDTMADALADASAPPGTPRHRASDEATIANRPLDSIVVLDRLLGGADPLIARSIESSRLGTCGISLGGWTTLRINSLDRRPKASFVAAPSWGDHGPFPQTRLQTSYVRLDDWSRQVPIFLVAGERDMLVMLADLRELHRQLQAPKRFAILKGASHFHWAEGAEALYEGCRAMWEAGAIQVPGVDVVALANATPPFSALCPNWHGTDTLQSLCLAHMDAHLKDMPEAHTFLDHDLSERFAARGIGLDVAADRTVTV